MPFNRQESRDKQTLGNPTSKRWTRNFKVDDAILIVIFFIRTPAWNGSLTGVFGGIISEPVYAFCSSFAAALPKAKRYILKKKNFVQYIHLWKFCQDFTWNYGGVLFESMDVNAAAGFQHKKGGLTRGTPWRSTHLYQCWSEIFLGMVIVRMLMPLWFI